MSIDNSLSTELSGTRFHVVLSLGGTEVKRLNTRKRKRIAHVTSAYEFDSAYLRVSYGNGFDNEGIYPTREALLSALSAFAEPELIERMRQL